MPVWVFAAILIQQVISEGDGIRLDENRDTKTYISDVQLIQTNASGVYECITCTSTSGSSDTQVSNCNLRAPNHPIGTSTGCILLNNGARAFVHGCTMKSPGSCVYIHNGANCYVYDSVLQTEATNSLSGGGSYGLANVTASSGINGSLTALFANINFNEEADIELID
jgi:hypothetical protein